MLFKQKTYAKDSVTEDQNDRLEEKENGGAHGEKELLSGKREKRPN